MNGLMAGVIGVALVGAYLVGTFVGPSLGDEDVVGASRTTAGAAAFVPVEPVEFADPEGDASDVGIGDTATYAACFVGNMLRGKCLEGAPHVASPTRAPHLDILGVEVEEAVDEIVVRLMVGKLSEGFPELESKDGVHRMVHYEVCWGVRDDDACSRYMHLMPMRHDGQGHATASFEVFVEDCNEWWWCSWPLPVHIDYGAPATIWFHVPKAWAAIDGEPLKMNEITASTWWVDEATAFPMWHPGVTVHTPVRHTHDHGGGVATFGVGDMTMELPARLAFSPHTSERATPPDAPLISGLAGSMHGAGSPYDSPALDLVGFDVHEEGQDLVLVLALKEAAAKPEFDFDYSVALGRMNGEVLEIGYHQAQGHAMGYAGECIMGECQDGGVFEVPAEFIPGSPAFIVIHVPRDVLKELGDPQPGERTTLAWVSSMYTEGSQYWGDTSSDWYGDVHHAFMVDELGGALPFTFGSGHHAPFEAFAEAAGAHHG